MKTAIICYNCKKLKKFSDSYAVKIVSTGDEIRAGLADNDPYKTRVCRPCTKRMGYKVKAKPVAKKVKAVGGLTFSAGGGGIPYGGGYRTAAAGGKIKYRKSFTV